MPLASAPRTNPYIENLTVRFRELGLTRDYIRRMTQRGDDLRSPLIPTREASLIDDPAAVVMRLFFCDEPIARHVVRGLLGEELFQTCRAAGLILEAEGERVSAPFHLRIVRELYLFSDYLGDDPDAVMGAGETTAVLFQAGRPKQHIRRALDLGCGAGTLALLLAGDADRVTGTDINPRAVALARFNAAVNGMQNVDFREGDVYVPVDGERFDLILSQPPYYPNPAAGAGLTFLHGGERGDELARRVVAGIPDHLADGGRAIVFTSWPEGSSAPALSGFRMLELKTNRRELHGTRQSLTVIERAGESGEWQVSFAVAPDCWGDVRPQRIDQIIEAEELLRAPVAALMNARLRLPVGSHAFCEDSQMLVRCPAEALVGCVPVDHQTWGLISAVNRAVTVRAGIEESMEALEEVRAAVRRGLLVTQR